MFWTLAKYLLNASRRAELTEFQCSLNRVWCPVRFLKNCDTSSAVSPSPRLVRQYLRASTNTSLIAWFSGPVVSYLRCTAAGRLNHSEIDQIWSVNPAAIAGVRCRYFFFPTFSRSVRTGQQKLALYSVK